MFTEEYLDLLPNEPLLAISEVIKSSLYKWSNLPEKGEGEEYEYFLEAFAIVQALANQVNDVVLNVPELSGDPQEIAEQVYIFFRYAESEISRHLVALKMAQLNNKYHAKYGNAFAYEFSEGDLNRIQTLVNSLRDLVSKSELFDPEHKRRVLLRLEKVQSEMHKKMSDLDRFWGLVGDAGVALGKFGDDAKPIVDRIREIAQIVWRTQARAEELPSDSPMQLLSKEEKNPLD